MGNADRGEVYGYSLLLPKRPQTECQRLPGWTDRDLSLLRGKNANPVGKHSAKLAAAAVPSAGGGSQGRGGFADDASAAGLARRPASRVISRDPLAEEGDVVWYVHPPSGGQFGPAAADVMRAWIAEGRIGADSLVWREGWRNWQTAGNVFPQLSPTHSLSDPEPAQPDLVDTSTRPRVAANYRHKRSNIVQIVFIASLTLTIIVLFFILYAIFKQ